MMVISLHCVTTEVRELPMYDGMTAVDEFESEVLEQQGFDALKWALRATPSRWRGTHQQNFEDWRECRKMMHLRFRKPQIGWKPSRMNETAYVPAFSDGYRCMVRNLHE